MDHKLDILCKKFVLIGHYALMLGNRSQYAKVTLTNIKKIQNTFGT